MKFKDLVESACDILNTKYTFDDSNNIFTIQIDFEDGEQEKVYVYEDVFESEDTEEQKSIVVCESFVDNYNEDIDLLLLSGSNEDLFFSKTYISEDKKILVESCSFLDNLTDVNLSVIIDEVAQQSNFVREEIL